MKARVHSDEGKIILSIGMIVKNEERFLRGCLEALKPLMQQVRSELIIVDTGSTDKTEEIAKEYTNQVLPFAWCNDFAAARNFGLSRAKGEWFLFIDADEYFVEVSGIAAFLNSAIKQKFDAASYTLRSFFDDKMQSFADHPIRRLFKMYDGIKFEHPIHEGIMLRPQDVLYVIPNNALADHFGYSSQMGEKFRQAKHERNLILLKEALERNPEDNHMIVHMVKECYAFEELDEGIRYALKGIELERQHPHFEMRCFYYNRLLSMYLGKKQANKALETAKEYFERNERPYTTDLDIYFNRAIQYIQLSEFENAKKDLEKYLEGHQAYCNKTLLTSDIFVDPIVTTQEDYYHRGLSNYAICLTMLEEYDNALAALNKIKPREVGVQKDDLCYLTAEFTLIEKTENYERIAVLYQQIKAQEDEDKLKIIQRYIDGFVIKHKDERKMIAKILVDKFKNAENDYIKLQKLRLAAAEENVAELHSLLHCFLESPLTAEYSDVLYFALKEGLDVSLLAKAVDFADIPVFAARIEQKYSEYAELVYAYFATREPPATMLELRFVIELKERAIMSDDLDKEPYALLFQGYCQDLILYTYNAVVPEMLEEENINGLPKLYRFAYHMNMANNYLQANQAANYVKLLKAALCDNQNMKRPIKMLLAEVEDGLQEQEKQQAAQQKEFDAYAAELKAKVKQLLQAGEYAAAAQIADALQKLLPNDKELKQYQAVLKEKTKE